MPLQTKAIEIRDRMTFIPAMATLMEANDDASRYLLRRSGYRGEGTVILCNINNAKSQNDPYDWPDNPRTMRQAHIWIEENWDEIGSGDVVDVEFILGETKTKKSSERYAES